MTDPLQQLASREDREPDFQRVKTLYVFFTERNALTRLRTFDAELSDHLKSGWFKEDVNLAVAADATFCKTAILRRFIPVGSDEVPF